MPNHRKGVKIYNKVLMIFLRSIAVLINRWDAVVSLYIITRMHLTSSLADIRHQILIYHCFLGGFLLVFSSIYLNAFQWNDL